jgi:luciferase family oxidoreductase group 1
MNPEEESSMDFGIFDEINAVAGVSATDVFAAHVQQMIAADRLGYDSYWLAEHHFSEHRMSPSPNLLLAAAALQTERILLGNMVNVLPFHQPVRLAEECAMLDHLTGGRLQVGIGRGVQPLEFSRQGRDMALSREMFDESAEMLIDLWSREGATREGRHWRYEDVTLMPPVLQRPYPPVWYAGMSRDSVRWAAEHGMPFVSSFLTNDELEDLGAFYRSHFVPSHHTPAPYFGVMRHVYVGESREQAQRDVGDVYDKLFAAWLDVALTDANNVPVSYKAYPDMHRRLGAMRLEDLLAEGLVLFGDADDVGRGVADLRDRGVDMLMLWVSPRDVPLHLVDDCIARFASDVMPALRAAAPVR